MTQSWHTLFWDLDGTITDPRHGIIGAYQAVLKELNMVVPAENDMLWVIGPPLRECIKTLLKLEDPLQIEQMVLRYRHWYVNEGLMYKDTPYPGIRELLTTLQTQKTRMFVATAKAHSYARQILEHWKLDGHFEEIHGSELDGTRSNKADLLKWMLEKYKIDSSTDVVMIGDRRHDAAAGQAHGLTTIGVGYGYGSKNELTEAGVNYYCSDLPSLSNLLISKNKK